VPDRPRTATDYTPELTTSARETLLYIATTLGDLLDQIVLVGGLVPSLIVKESSYVPVHVGTMDVDLGLAFGLLKTRRYTEVSSRLRKAGFAPDVNREGNPTRQRWVIEVDGKPPGKVDFLIQPPNPESKGGKQQDLEADFAAITTPGLHLAFQDLVTVSIDGHTIKGETAKRDIQVCGPGAYIILKALAVRGRNEPKDSYDLQHVVRFFGKSLKDVVARLVPLLNDPVTKEALSFLAEDFKSPDSIGPSRAAEFLGTPEDVNLKADIVGAVKDLLRITGFKA
jgi:hypothetical protein